MIRKIRDLFKRKPVYRYRSAITGLFVSEAYAKAFPDITIRERSK